MARPKTHKIALRTRGLTDEEAARLHYILSYAAAAFTEDYETASNVPLKTLRELFPDGDWGRSSTKERLDLVS